MADWRWLIVLALIALIIGVMVARWQRPSAPPQDVSTRMASLAAEAVTRAEAEFGAKLDFSARSVGQLEDILGKFHVQFASGQLSPERLDREAMTWGAYIGELIRRVKGGHWERDHHVAGPRSYPIHYEGHESFPCGWCFKRIRNGDEDNVWHKFQILAMGEGEGGIVIDGTPETP